MWPTRIASRSSSYLDALDLAWGTGRNSPSPSFTGAYRHGPGVGATLAAYLARTEGYRVPISEVRQQVLTDPAGRILEGVTPPEVSRKIYDGLEPAEYNRIKRRLSGFSSHELRNTVTPYFAELDRAKQADYERTIPPLAEWMGRALQHFREDVKGVKVVEIPETCHYLFIKDEASRRS